MPCRYCFVTLILIVSHCVSCWEVLPAPGPVGCSADPASMHCMAHGCEQGDSSPAAAAWRMADCTARSLCWGSRESLLVRRSGSMCLWVQFIEREPVCLLVNACVRGPLLVCASVCHAMLCSLVPVAQPAYFTGPGGVRGQSAVLLVLRACLIREANPAWILLDKCVSA